MLKKAIFAEFVGTFILVFAGTGAIVVDALTGAITHIGVALTFGAVVSALIYTFGHISGAHFNPAVTIGFASINKFERKNVAPYVAAQIGGAVFASVVLYLMFRDSAQNLESIKYLGATLPKFGAFNSFVMELILTFILMLVICGSAIHGRAIKSFAGIAIGLTVALEAMFAGPVSGASMNPARSISPALISLHFEHLWIYIFATISGALVAAFSYEKFVKCKDENECCLAT